LSTPDLEDIIYSLTIYPLKGLNKQDLNIVMRKLYENLN